MQRTELVRAPVERFFQVEQALPQRGELVAGQWVELSRRSPESNTLQETSPVPIVRDGELSINEQQQIDQVRASILGLHMGQDTGLSHAPVVQEMTWNSTVAATEAPKQPLDILRGKMMKKGVIPAKAA